MDSNEFYINSVSAKYLSQNNHDPYFDQKKEGWYWHDKHDNSIYKGVYKTEYEAIEAGKEYRRNLVGNNFNGKLVLIN